MSKLAGKNDLLRLLRNVKNIGFGYEDLVQIKDHFSYILEMLVEERQLFQWYFEFFYFSLSCLISNILSVNIQKFELKLSAELRSAFDNFPEWSIEQFFTLSVGHHFIYELKSDKYTQIDSINMYKRPMMIQDIDKVECDIKRCYKDQFSVLYRKFKEKWGTDLAKPIVLLEFSENLKLYISKYGDGKTYPSMTLIDIKMAQLIRCWHYNFDMVRMKNGTPCAMYETYNVDQMAEVIGKYKGMTQSKDDVLRFCLSQPFGVYVKSEMYDVKVDVSINHIPATEEINAAYESEEIDKNYIYPYEGLVRLYKSSNHPWYKELTLKFILNSGRIKILHPNSKERSDKNKKYSLPFLPLALSVSEYLLGIRKVIQPFSDQPEIQITADDLIFLKHEVDHCIGRVDKKEATNSEVKPEANGATGSGNAIWYELSSKLCEIIRKNSQSCRIDSTVAGIRSILDAVKKLRPDFDSMNMPGTVDDFYKFCRELGNSKQIFRQGKNAFYQYCKGKIGSRKKLKALCGWSGSKSNPEFWNEIKKSFE